ncbi:MAG: hypothetical protein GEU73_17150 [Chloroflexi bacterium]|nr:hypothetical protein [Chloroflexota bacterium]
MLRGDIVEEVRKLKQDDGNDLRTIGSASLVKALAAHDLVDEYQLMIDPVIVGGGKRQFGDGFAFSRLRLVQSRVTTTGAIIATYAPAAD